MGGAINGTRLAPITDELPAGFDDLRFEARAEGYQFLDRLAGDWAAGAMRFDGRGELLLAGFVNGDLAGIGGLTAEPVVRDALRMRRFYVRPLHRRAGIGRQLVLALLEHGRQGAALVTVNAQKASFPFWESVGFVSVTSEGLTHIRGLAAERTR